MIICYNVQVFIHTDIIYYNVHVFIHTNKYIDTQILTNPPSVTFQKYSYLLN